uniref:Cytoplasmic protein n=1 Tax=viral metagenome TaxID=1070528 RepID=A0A6M3LKA2_9ZZZZ
MQTFLPYKNFIESAICLDYKRLGKQRVEAKQIIEILEGKPSRWKNHPAVKMWVGYIDTLKVYYNIIVQEWINKGYKNNMKFFQPSDVIEYPPWLGDDKFHASHRSNLLRKDPKWYSQFGWTEPNNLPYVWPV